MLSKTLRFAVQLGRFAAQNNLDIGDAAELVALAGKVFTTGERDANTGSESSFRAYDKATKEFARKAESLGFAAQFPGLWPNLVKDGREVYIPSEK